MTTWEVYADISGTWGDSRQRRPIIPNADVEASHVVFIQPPWPPDEDDWEKSYEEEENWEYEYPEHDYPEEDDEELDFRKYYDEEADDDEYDCPKQDDDEEVSYSTNNLSRGTSLGPVHKGRLALKDSKLNPKFRSPQYSLPGYTPEACRALGEAAALINLRDEIQHQHLMLKQIWYLRLREHGSDARPREVSHSGKSPDSSPNQPRYVSLGPACKGRRHLEVRALNPKYGSPRYLLPGDTPEVCRALANAAALVAITDGIQPPLLILEREWHRRLRTDLCKAPTIPRRILKLPNAIPSLTKICCEKEEALANLHVKPSVFIEDKEVAGRERPSQPAVAISLKGERDIVKTEAKNKETKRQAPNADFPRISTHPIVWKLFFNDIMKMGKWEILRKTKRQRRLKAKLHRPISPLIKPIPPPVELVPPPKNESLPKSTLLGPDLFIEGEVVPRFDLHALLDEYTNARPWPTFNPQKANSAVCQMGQQWKDNLNATVADPSLHSQNKAEPLKDALQIPIPGYKKHTIALLNGLNFTLPELPMDETNNIYTLIRESGPLNNHGPPSSRETTTVPVSKIYDYERRIQELEDRIKNYQTQNKNLQVENRMLKDYRFGGELMSRVDL